MTDDSIQILKSIVDDPFTRFFLSHLGCCENYDAYLSSDPGCILNKKEHQLIAQKISK